MVVGVLATVISVAALAARLPAAKRPRVPRARAPRAPVPSQLLRIARIVERWARAAWQRTRCCGPCCRNGRTGLARRGVKLNRDHNEARRSSPRRRTSFVRTARRLTTAPRLAPRELEAVLDNSRGAVSFFRRQTGARAARILDEVERAVVGKRAALELVLLGLLADGHVLIEGVPGTAKTLMARSFAAVDRPAVHARAVHAGPDAVRHHRLGDLRPAQRRASTSSPGRCSPTSCSADEINRAPPKTQAALLEAMQERQVTSGRHAHALPRPFLVLATQNPIEHEGTYPLPEAQLDRFLVRVASGTLIETPSSSCSRARLARGQRRRRARQRSSTATSCWRCSARLSGPRGRSASWATSSIVPATRANAQRPGRREPARGARRAQAGAGLAALDGRDFVMPDDVKRVAVPALAHRITLRPELWVQQVSAEDIVRDCLDGCRRRAVRVP